MASVIAYIGLGSNLQDPKLQIKLAVGNLEARRGISVISDAGYFSSIPMGPEDQPDFINSVVKIETVLDVKSLLLECQMIEQEQGRIKKRHWGERTIDLDILLYGNECFQDDTLTVPHVGVAERDFVYLPLLKLEPEIVIPQLGRLQDLVQSKNANTDYACHYLGNIE